MAHIIIIANADGVLLIYYYHAFITVWYIMQYHIYIYFDSYCKNQTPMKTVLTLSSQLFWGLSSKSTEFHVSD